MERLSRILSHITFPLSSPTSLYPLQCLQESTRSLSTAVLGQSFHLGSLELQNRFVMAPMTRSKSPGQVPGANVAQYYRRRAEGKVGLVLTEGTIIHPTGHGYPDVPNFYEKAALEGWRRVVTEVHQVGGKIFPQLWHVGSMRHPTKPQNNGGDSISKSYAPSPILHPSFKEGDIPTEMSLQDINEIIEAFTEAARNAKNLGFDGIELHGAHGYLIDQFFWSVTNKRKDHYGGETCAERTRFAVDIIKSVRKAVGLDFPIILRFSQWKIGAYSEKLARTPEELKSFLSPLVDAGVDIFHCSQRRFYDPEFPDVSSLNLAGWTKRLTGKPTITVGSIGLESDFMQQGTNPATPQSGLQDVNSKTLEKLAVLIESLKAEDYDLAAVGRALIGDPHWVEKVIQKRFKEILPYTSKMEQDVY